MPREAAYFRDYRRTSPYHGSETVLTIDCIEIIKIKDFLEF